MPADTAYMAGLRQQGKVLVPCARFGSQASAYLLDPNVVGVYCTGRGPDGDDGVAQCEMKVRYRGEGYVPPDPPVSCSARVGQNPRERG